MDTSVATEQMELRDLSKGEKNMQDIPPRSITRIGNLLSTVLNFLDNIADDIEDEIVLSIFADDVVVSCTYTNLEVASGRLQTRLATSGKCSKNFHLTISIPNCKAMCFTTNNCELHWNLRLEIDGEKLSTPETISSWENYMTIS